MALLDAINATTVPFYSPGTASDTAAGYLVYPLAAIEQIDRGDGSYFQARDPVGISHIAAPENLILSTTEGRANGLIDSAPAAGTYRLAFFNSVSDQWLGDDELIIVTSVIDTEAPLLTLNGLATINLTQGDEFIDPGASWVDNVDGSGTIVSATPLDTADVGSTLLQYQYVDAAGHSSNVVTRTINVFAPSDRQAPVLTLNGLPTMRLTQGETFIDPGANWVDNIDGAGIVFSVSPIDTTVVGSNLLQYQYTDAAGNVSNIVNRTVEIAEIITVQAPIRDQLIRAGNSWVLGIATNLFSGQPDEISASLIDDSPLPEGMTFNGTQFAWSPTVFGTYFIKIEAIASGRVVASDHFALDVDLEQSLVNALITNKNDVPWSGVAVEWVVSNGFGGPVIGSGIHTTNAAGYFIYPLTIPAGTAVWLSVRRIADNESDIGEVVTVVA
ncbi:MAG: DUF5011 domain-containing protein [Cellvibrionaceae bacterium]|nr:DUF5011 domain-containing protein [Cellvibrionaceae bacterium]